MGGWLAGFAGSLGDHLHEQHLLSLQQQVESKRNLLDNYNTLLKDPHMQDVHGEIAQTLLKAASTDPTKLHKQIGKPGGEFDPTQWQVLAQQRAAGMQPSPVNQGQNPTQIPAAPPGHEQAPGGQAQTAPSWQDAQAAGMGAGNSPTGGIDIPPPPVAQAAGGQAAQSIQALPPAPGGGPAPDAATVVSPQAASAISPPPPMQAQAQAQSPSRPSFQYGPLGSIPQEELNRRGIAYQSQLEEAKNQAELTRLKGIASFNTEQEQQKLQNHINSLKALGVWDQMTSREKAAAVTGIQTFGTTPPSTAKVEPDDNSPTRYSTKFYDRGGNLINTAVGATPPPQKTIWGADPNDKTREIGYLEDRTGKKTPTGEYRFKPGMMETDRSSITTIDSEGNQHTGTQSKKVTPGTGGGAAKIPPPPGSVSTPPFSSSAPAPKPVRIFNPNDRIDNIVRLMGQDQQSGEKLMTSRQDKVAVGKRMAELGIDPNNVTGSMRDRAAQARTVLPHLDDILKIIDEADKAGELGLVATRWNDFLTNKLGKDPTKNQIFTKLSSNLGFLTTAVGMAHGGTRAGSSEPIIEHWERTLQAADPATLKQKLNTAKAWMENYANLVPKGKGGEIGAPPGSDSGGVTELERGPDGKLRIKGK